jgi:hypothetical protein
MRPVGELNLGAAEQLPVSFVYKRRRLEGMAGTLTAKMPLRDATKRGIHHLHQFVAGNCVPGAQLPQQLRDVFIPFRSTNNCLPQ